MLPSVSKKGGDPGGNEEMVSKALHAGRRDLKVKLGWGQGEGLGEKKSSNSSGILPLCISSFHRGAGPSVD